MNELDVVVTQPVDLDRIFFQFWLKGETVASAALQRFKTHEKAETSQLQSYAYSQYRIFDMLDPFLQRPVGIRDEGKTKVPILSVQMLIPLPPHVQMTMIEMYYEFDDAVLRELLGKRLSSRLRKDLEDISEETKVSLVSCRRQFDNMKRVSKTVEDLPGGIIQHIQSFFLVSHGLATKYARVIFISKNRLEISAHKKRLMGLSFQDIEYCAGAFMDHWCTMDHGQPTSDLDPSFLRDIADAKIISVGTNDLLDEYRDLVILQVGRDSAVVKQKHLFRQVLRNFISIGAGLRLEKEFRDIFVDLIEKIVEPCQKANWTTKDMEAFINAVKDKFSSLQSIDYSTRDRIQGALESFCNAMRLCMHRLFPKLTLQ